MRLAPQRRGPFDWISEYLARRLRAGLSGGETRVSADGNMYVKGDVNGDPSTPLRVDSDCNDEDIILRAYGEFILKSFPGTVENTNMYSWFTRTKGNNATQEAWQPRGVLYKKHGSGV